MSLLHDIGYVIIGVDPGGTTGVFVYYEDGTRDFNQLKPEEVAPNLDDFLRRWTHYVGAERIHVAVEKYIITARTAMLSQQPEAMELTGAVKALAALHGVTQVRQFLKSNLRYASDDVLRTIGWAHPSYPHATDAARQAFAVLRDIDPPRWTAMMRNAKVGTTTEEG